MRPVSLSLPSTGVTRLQRYCEPLRHPTAPGLSLAGVRLVIPDLALGLPLLRTLSLCTCCRHYPGAAARRTLRSLHPAVSAFPERVVGSACTSSFSRLAQRSLALRPAHSRGHQFVARYTEGFSHFVTSMTAPVASGWSGCRVGLAPTGKRRLSRRTPIAAVRPRVLSDAFRPADAWWQRAICRRCRRTDYWRGMYLVASPRPGRTAPARWPGPSPRRKRRQRPRSPPGVPRRSGRATTVPGTARPRPSPGRPQHRD